MLGRQMLLVNGAPLCELKKHGGQKHAAMSKRVCYNVLGVVFGRQVFVRYVLCVGLARTIYIRCTYGIFGLEITKYTVYIYTYIRFWPTLVMCIQACPHIHLIATLLCVYKRVCALCVMSIQACTHIHLIATLHYVFTSVFVRYVL